MDTPWNFHISIFNLPFSRPRVSVTYLSFSPQDEGQMPLDELMKKYGGGGPSKPIPAPTPDSRPDSESDSEEGSVDEDEGAEEDEAEEDEEEPEDAEEETEMEIGLKSLLDVNASDHGDATKVKCNVV